MQEIKVGDKVRINMGCKYDFSIGVATILEIGQLPGPYNMELVTVKVEEIEVDKRPLLVRNTINWNLGISRSQVLEVLS